VERFRPAGMGRSIIVYTIILSILIVILLVAYPIPTEKPLTPVGALLPPSGSLVAHVSTPHRGSTLVIAASTGTGAGQLAILDPDGKIIYTGNISEGKILTAHIKLEKPGNYTIVLTATRTATTTALSGYLETREPAYKTGYAAIPVLLTGIIGYMIGAASRAED